jgi:sulfatase maturation enzyme AslB (radical SAM superfamily)
MRGRRCRIDDRDDRDERVAGCGCYASRVGWRSSGMGTSRLMQRARRAFHRLSGRRGRRRELANRSRDLTGRFCGNPFGQADIYENGKVFVCCSDWLPTPIGNLERQTMGQVWNSPTAQAIRESILDGSFRYCDHRVCPLIQNDSLPTLEEAARDPRFADAIAGARTVLDEPPTFINLCNDASCNLYCPSCRSERINHASGRAYRKRAHLQDRIVAELFSEPTDRRFRVSVTGSGDPFASKVFRDFLFGLDGRDFPNLEVSLQTNGVLLTPRSWQRLHRIRDNITDVIVSFDAATPGTYAITRRGGHWPTLIDNVRALGERRAAGELRYLKLDFVVQQANYREMPAFVDLGRSLGADRVGFSLVMNWGTWSAAEFNVRAIWRRDHPEFGEFLDVLRDPRLADPVADLGNVSEYRRSALRAAA